MKLSGRTAHLQVTITRYAQACDCTAKVGISMRFSHHIF
jgi:hypothetical protein